MRPSAILFALLASCSHLPGQLNFCNSAPLTIETAVGYPDGDQWFTAGWYSVDPGECHTILPRELTNRYYYSFAQTAGGRFRWNGNMQLCGANAVFTIRHPDCEADAQLPYTQIDTGGARSLNYWFSCPECLDQTMVAAVRRYLPYLQQLADEQVPLSYRTPDWQDIGPVDIQYGVSRGGFLIGFDGNRVSLSTRLSYWLSVSNMIPIFGRNGLASCGVDEAEPVADIAAEIIVGLKRDGHLHSKTRIANLSFPNPCNLTFLNIDARGYIEAAVRPQLDRLTSIIDSQIATIDVARIVNVEKLYDGR